MPPMSYLIDRQAALWGGDVIALVTSARRGERSRVILRDNSLHRSRSRAKTLMETSRRGSRGITEPGRGQRATWRRPQ